MSTVGSWLGLGVSSPKIRYGRQVDGRKRANTEPVRPHVHSVEPAVVRAESTRVLLAICAGLRYVMVTKPALMTTAETSFPVIVAASPAAVLSVGNEAFA